MGKSFSRSSRLVANPASAALDSAMGTLIAKHDGDLLERAFSLFKAELIEVDRGYARKTDLEHLTIDDFCDRFFAERMAADPFDWAESNLGRGKAELWSRDRGRLALCDPPDARGRGMRRTATTSMRRNRRSRSIRPLVTNAVTFI